MEAGVCSQRGEAGDSFQGAHRTGREVCRHTGWGRNPEKAQGGGKLLASQLDHRRAPPHFSLCGGVSGGTGRSAGPRGAGLGEGWGEQGQRRGLSAGGAAVCGTWTVTMATAKSSLDSQLPLQWPGARGVSRPPTRSGAPFNWQLQKTRERKKKTLKQEVSLSLTDYWQQVGTG